MVGTSRQRSNSSNLGLLQSHASNGKHLWWPIGLHKPTREFLEHVEHGLRRNPTCKAPNSGFGIPYCSTHLPPKRCFLTCINKDKQCNGKNQRGDCDLGQTPTPTKTVLLVDTITSNSACLHFGEVTGLCISKLVMFWFNPTTQQLCRCSTNPFPQLAWTTSRRTSTLRSL